MPTSTITVPEETKKKFPDLIDLILKSESMNDEERQYWINILPIITQDQIQNLRDILDNERRQLAAIDQKYAQEIERIGQTQSVAQTEEERRQKRTDRQSQENANEREEEQVAEDLLKKIEENGKA